MKKDLLKPNNISINQLRSKKQNSKRLNLIIESNDKAKKNRSSKPLNLSNVKSLSRRGYSSTSKEKINAKQIRLDNSVASVVSIKSKIKSPENSKKLKSNLCHQNLKLGRNSYVRSESKSSLDTKSKKDTEVKIIPDSSVKPSEKKINAYSSKKKSNSKLNKLENPKGKIENIKKISSASRRINSLNEGDPKKVDELIDKIKTKSNLTTERVIKQKSIGRKPLKKEKIEESDDEEIIELDTTSKKLKNKKKSLREKQKERSRDEKISLEKIKISESEIKKLNKKNLGKKKNNNIKNLKILNDEKVKSILKNESTSNIKHIVKKTSFTPITLKKENSDEEISISDESEQKSKISREKKILKKPLCQKSAPGIDKAQISDEISKIIKRIEEKRKKTNLIEKIKSYKPKISSSTKREKNITAESFNGILQLNKNIKVNNILDIVELSKNDSFKKTDVLLAIIEVALNSSYYSLSSFNRAKSFWEDVLKYKDLKKIFDPLKAETLKKYWININSNGDPIQVADFVKKYKKNFEENKIVLLPMISTAGEYFKQKIDNVENYIKNLPREPQVREIKLIQTIDDFSGKIKTEEKKTLITFKRTRHSEPVNRKFRGKNSLNNPDEIIEGTKSLIGAEESNFPRILDLIEKDERIKNEFLYSLKEEEKNKVFSINDEDKFIIKKIEELIKKLIIIFPKYSDIFILESLKGNSFNLHHSFKYLNDPINQSNDEIIRHMRNTENFTKLCDEKGKANVYLRLDYLNI